MAEERTEAGRTRAPRAAPVPRQIPRGESTPSSHSLRTAREEAEAAVAALASEDGGAALPASDAVELSLRGGTLLVERKPKGVRIVLCDYNIGDLAGAKLPVDDKGEKYILTEIP